MTRFSLAILVLLFTALPLSASSVVLGTPEPVSAIEYMPSGGQSERAIGVANGDRMLVVWNRGEGAVRLDEEGHPLDIPAILLPKPERTAGADVIADGDDWRVGWTIFSLDDSISALRLARVTRDGDVTEIEERALPAFVEQNTTMHLAEREGVLVAAYQMAWNADFDIAVVTESALFKVQGELREFAATSDGFALALRDRVVRLAANGAPLSDVALPADFIPTDVTAEGNDLWIGGDSPTGPVVLRLRGGSTEVEIVAQIASIGGNARIGVSGGKIMVVWIAPKETPPHPYIVTPWDLLAASVNADGSGEEPQRLRDSIDVSGRWVAPDHPLVERVGDEWIAVWSEGVRQPGIVWRNLYSEVLSDPLGAIDQPALITFRASDQSLVGTAVFDDVLLTVWYGSHDPLRTEPSRYALRTGLDGRRIDSAPIDLGPIPAFAVRATDTGFVILASDRQVRIGVKGPPVHDTIAPMLRDIACAKDGCIAVWMEGETPGGPSSIRYAPWRDGVLAPAVTIHASDLPYRDLALASDDGGALLAFARVGTPGGTVITAARIERTSDGWTHRISDFAAGPTDFYRLRLVRQFDRYLAIWIDPALGYRASQLTLAGHSMDGDETGWSGWPFAVDGEIDEAAFDGTRTLLLVNRWPQRNAIYELHGRTLVLVAQVDSDRASIECARSRRCAIVFQIEMVGDPWYRASRLFLQQFWFARPRAVRH